MDADDEPPDEELAALPPELPAELPAELSLLAADAPPEGFASDDPAPEDAAAPDPEAAVPEAPVLGVVGLVAVALAESAFSADLYPSER